MPINNKEHFLSRVHMFRVRNEDISHEKSTGCYIRSIHPHPHIKQYMAQYINLLLIFLKGYYATFFDFAFIKRVTFLRSGRKFIREIMT